MHDGRRLGATTLCHAELAVTSNRFQLPFESNRPIEAPLRIAARHWPSPVPVRAEFALTLRISSDTVYAACMHQAFGRHE